jgi:hypothetical protein
MKNKTTITLYKDIQPLVNMMTNEQAGILLKSIYSYSCDDIIPECEDVIVSNTFKFIKEKMDDLDAKYKQKSEKNRANANKRWADNATKSNSDNATAFSGDANACEPMPTDTNTDTDADTDLLSSDNKVSTKKPSVDEMNFAFSKFWENYGNKKGRGHALKAFNKLSVHDIQKVLDVVQSPEFQNHQKSLIKKNGDFRKHPSTWLNAEGWKDELSIQNKQAPAITIFQDNEEPF